MTFSVAVLTFFLRGEYLSEAADPDVPLLLTKAVACGGCLALSFLLRLLLSLLLILMLLLRGLVHCLLFLLFLRLLLLFLFLILLIFIPFSSPFLFSLLLLFLLLLLSSFSVFSSLPYSSIYWVFSFRSSNISFLLCVHIIYFVCVCLSVYLS